MRLIIANNPKIIWVNEPQKIQTAPMTMGQAMKIVLSLPRESIIDDPEIANVFSQILGVRVSARQICGGFKLRQDCMILLGEYVGPLEEGAIALPEGASVSWKLLTVA